MKPWFCGSPACSPVTGLSQVSMPDVLDKTLHPRVRQTMDDEANAMENMTARWCTKQVPVNKQYFAIRLSGNTIAKMTSGVRTTHMTLYRLTHTHKHTAHATRRSSETDLDTTASTHEQTPILPSSVGTRPVPYGLTRLQVILGLFCLPPPSWLRGSKRENRVTALSGEMKTPTDFRGDRSKCTKRFWNRKNILHVKKT